MSEITDKKEIAGLQETLQKFVVAARVENTPGVVCGDGGVPFAVTTTTGREVNVVGRAGDLGQDMATAVAIMAYNERHGIGYDPRELVGKVGSTYAYEHGSFQFHTSDHVHAPEKITDCGDMHGKMTDERYQVSLDKVRAAIEASQELAQADDTGEIEEQTLGDREHEELGVILVTGRTHTLVHWLRAEDSDKLPAGTPEDILGMWFVIDSERGAARRRTVLEALGYSPEQVTEILEIKAAQDQVTNARLAVGKQVFGVNADNPDDIQIEYLGEVQEDGSVA